MLNLASKNLLDSFRLGSMQKLDTQNRGRIQNPGAWDCNCKTRGGASSNSLITEKRATQQETNNRSPGSVTDSATEDNSHIPNRCSSTTDLTTQEKTNNQTRASVTKRRTPVGHSGSTNQTRERGGSTSQIPSGCSGSTGQTPGRSDSTSQTPGHKWFHQSDSCWV